MIETEYQRCPVECDADTPGLALGDDRQLDYPERQTTIGQENIEAVLAGKPISAARLLHVGIGNSRLAQRFSAQVQQIDGITMGSEEQLLAKQLELANYTVLLLNKYSQALGRLPPGYDFIIDNNIFSYACCKKHFMQMMSSYAALLKPTGELLTERRGLNWIYRKPDVVGMSFAELKAVAEGLQLQPGIYPGEVFYLRKHSETVR